MKKQMQLVRCTVNGREVEEYVDVRAVSYTHLLSVRTTVCTNVHVTSMKNL